MTAAPQTPGKPIANPESNAKLVKLVGEAYWKATGEAFYPDKKVIQAVLRVLDQACQLVERTERVPDTIEVSTLEVRADGQLTSRDFDGLSIDDLRLLLQTQQAKRQRACDITSAWRAYLGTVSTNIHNIKVRIRKMSPADEPTEVKDHAILRYLQRVKGMDIQAIRDEIDTPKLRDCIRNCEDGKFTLNGITYVVAGGALVTVIYDGEDAA